MSFYTHFFFAIPLSTEIKNIRPYLVYLVNVHQTEILL